MLYFFFAAISKFLSKRREVSGGHQIELIKSSALITFSEKRRSQLLSSLRMCFSSSVLTFPLAPPWNSFKSKVSLFFSHLLSMFQQLSVFLLCEWHSFLFFSTPLQNNSEYNIFLAFKGFEPEVCVQSAIPIQSEAHFEKTVNLIAKQLYFNINSAYT